MNLTNDEQDAMAANCPDCWAYPGEECWVRVNGRNTKRKRKHPHPNRIGRAGRRGILGGGGRMLLSRASYNPVRGWVT